MSITAVIDLDYIKYTAAAVGETRTVLVTHTPTGVQKSFDNKTSFYGRDKAKATGWLGDLNKSRLEEGKDSFKLEDFTIEDVQTPEPLENVLHTVKMMVQGDLEALKATSYISYLGEGESFRVERSTILEYKGNRKDTLKPLHLGEVVKYLNKKYNPITVTGIEADDAVTMAAYEKSDHVVVGVDKDYYGQPVKFFNVNKPEEGIVNGDQFGKLWIDDKKKVRGVGRMFLYLQIASGDASDNYKANSASDIRWGEKSAYDALVESKNDKEAWESLVSIYKKLYPEPKTITGWRGDEIEIDWLYVLRENFDMARMLRFEGDDVDAKDVLDRLGVKYV